MDVEFIVSPSACTLVNQHETQKVAVRISTGTPDKLQLLDVRSIEPLAMQNLMLDPGTYSIEAIGPNGMKAAVRCTIVPLTA